MNTHRAVRQYLAKEEKKTELKSERVELNVLNDIKNIQKLVQQKVEKARDNAKRIEKEFKAVNAENKKIAASLETIRNRASDIVIDARNKAKDLGLPLPQEFKDRYNQIENDMRMVPVSNLGNIFPI